MDKQLMQYLLTLRKNWRMLQDCSKFPNRNVQMFGYAFPRHKWPKSWANIVEPVILLERNMSGHPLAGLLWERQFEGSFIRTWMGEIPNWECMFAHRKQGLFLSVFVDDIKMDGKMQNLAPIVKKMITMWTLMNPHTFLAMYIWDALSVNANRMKQLLNNMRRCLNLVFLLEQQKNYRDGKNLTHKLKRGLTTWKDCSKLRWAILWIGKQESGATFQSFILLFGWSPIQTGGTRICWRNFRSLLTNCLEMLVTGTNWKTWHFMVSQQAWEISHKMDSGMWQTLGKANFLDSSHNDFRQHCHVRNMAQHRRQGLFQDSDFAGDLEDSN